MTPPASTAFCRCPTLSLGPGLETALVRKVDTVEPSSDRWVVSRARCCGRPGHMLISSILCKVGGYAIIAKIGNYVVSTQV